MPQLHSVQMLRKSSSAVPDCTILLAIRQTWRFVLTMQHLPGISTPDVAATLGDNHLRDFELATGPRRWRMSAKAGGRHRLGGCPLPGGGEKANGIGEPSPSARLCRAEVRRLTDEGGGAGWKAPRDSVCSPGPHERR